MNDKDIWFVIVTYRPEKKKLADLLKALSGRNVKVIDNSKNNLGYAGGANAGIKYAISHRAKWVVVCNQDISLGKNCASQLLNELNHVPPGIAGPLAGILDPLRFTASEIKNYSDATSPDYISGSCIAIHRDVVQSVGLFCEKFFLYYEEVDYCLRARKKGFAVTKITLPCFVHLRNHILGDNSFLHQYYLARNHLLFVERNAPWRVKIHEALRLPKTLLEHKRNNNNGGLEGIKDYFLRRLG